MLELILPFFGRNSRENLHNSGRFWPTHLVYHVISKSGIVSIEQKGKWSTLLCKRWKKSIWIIASICSAVWMRLKFKILKSITIFYQITDYRTKAKAMQYIPVRDVIRRGILCYTLRVTNAVAVDAYTIFNVLFFWKINHLIKSNNI